MVCPDGKAQEADSHARPGNEGIAKDRLTGKDRQYLRDNAKGGQDQDIHLWMPKRPEEMLPEQGIAAECVLIEMCTQVAVQQQQNGSSGQAGQSKQQQEGCHQG